MYVRPPSSVKPTANDGIVHGTRLYWAVSIALFLAGFSTFSLLYCVQPLLPVFSQHFGIGAAKSSLVLSVTSTALALSIVLVSALSENWGRRGLMFVSMLLASLLNIAVAYAPNWNALLILRAVEGFILGGVPAVAMAYLAEEIELSGLGLSMGIYVGGTAFGGMLGRVGMSVLYERYSWQTAIITIGILDSAAAIGFYLLLPPSRRFSPKKGLDFRLHVTAWKNHLSNSRLPWLFLTGFIVMEVFVTVYNYAGFRLSSPPYSLSETKIGLIFLAYFFGIAASSLAGGFADKVGRSKMLLCGLSLSIGGLGLTMLASIYVIIAGIILITIGFFIAHSVASSWVGKVANGNKGHASALYLLSYYLGSSVLGSAGGGIWEIFGWSGLVFYGVMLLIVTCYAALSLQHLE